MSTTAGERTLFLFEKPSAMRHLQRLFRSPNTVCVAAEGHLLRAEEPGDIRPEWKPWRFEALPIVLDAIPVRVGENRSGQSHGPKLDAIGRALRGVDRVVIATDPGREGSMIGWEVLEHLGWRGRVDRLRLGALDDLSIRRAFAAMRQEPDSGARDYAAYLEALCRQYEDYHLGLNGTRAISLRLRPVAFREPWRFGGVQTPTLAILADLEECIRRLVPRDVFKVALPVVTRTGARLTLWHAPKERIFERETAEAIREAAARWAGRLAVEQKDVRRPPPKLFSKDTLARRCAKRFSWDPQHTAKLAQDLYDRGTLSYPRTESEHLPDSQAGGGRSLPPAHAQARRRAGRGDLLLGGARRAAERGGDGRPVPRADGRNGGLRRLARGAEGLEAAARPQERRPDLPHLPRRTCRTTAGATPDSPRGRRPAAQPRDGALCPAAGPARRRDLSAGGGRRLRCLPTLPRRPRWGRAAQGWHRIEKAQGSRRSAAGSATARPRGSDRSHDGIGPT